ncbi:hypothetical protein RFI_00005 [Reticulomyxa filosa]|uniref:Uncharacterized protein n=1 Tax=Reticulomyxa filosa TaxID=46433 RepID=X6PH79_RETFI|nr:hypothetical protein RFI_00005 [Reticulomyxa filosa]|eukprot:ETO37057.1 hypothetical protein RFI_00005 [Reticulomyxa filosa]
MNFFFKKRSYETFFDTMYSYKRGLIIVLVLIITSVSVTLIVLMIYKVSLTTKVKEILWHTYYCTKVLHHQSEAQFVRFRLWSCRFSFHYYYGFFKYTLHTQYIYINNDTIHWHETREPAEDVLKVLVEKLHLPDAKKELNYQMIIEYVLEFTSMSVFVIQSSTRKGWLLVKGVIESLLECSSHIFVNFMDSDIPTTQIHKGEIDRTYHEFASE